MKSEQIITRVLSCLKAPRSGHQWLSISEVAEEYNRRYPPALGLFKVKEGVIRTAIDTLVNRGQVRFEVFEFMHLVPLDRPTKFFTVVDRKR